MRENLLHANFLFQRNLLKFRQCADFREGADSAFAHFQTVFLSLWAGGLGVMTQLYKTEIGGSILTPHGTCLQAHPSR